MVNVIFQCEVHFERSSIHVNIHHYPFNEIAELKITLTELAIYGRHLGLHLEYLHGNAIYGAFKVLYLKHIHSSLIWYINKMETNYHF